MRRAAASSILVSVMLLVVAGIAEAQQPTINSQAKSRRLRYSDAYGRHTRKIRPTWQPERV
jgi:hypothetical protein